MPLLQLFLGSPDRIDRVTTMDTDLGRNRNLTRRQNTRQTLCMVVEGVFLDDRLGIVLVRRCRAAARVMARTAVAGMAMVVTVAMPVSVRGVRMAMVLPVASAGGRLVAGRCLSGSAGGLIGR